MANRRDYKSEYARRNTLAQQAGWTSYSQERRANEKFRDMNLDVHSKWNRFRFNHMDLTKQQERSAFRAFYQGFLNPRTRDDTSRNSPKAEWLVDWVAVPVFQGDYDIWEEMYGGD